MFYRHFNDVFFCVLILVSIATHTTALPTDQPPVRHECEDKTLCHIKPIDYPQEEIDRAVLKQLPYLRRMKREIVEPAAHTSGENCVLEETTITPFTIGPEGSTHLPTFVVQSKWFNQTITEGKCVETSPSSQCFKLYLLPHYKTQCRPKTIFFNLIVYDKVENKTLTQSTPVVIDCVCAII